MAPTLNDGDWALYTPTAFDESLVGRVVVCEHPYKNKLMIKRVERFSDKENVFLLGDNPRDSTDSRVFGGVPITKVKGVVNAFLEGRKR